MSNLYDQLLTTLGVASGHAIYIIDTDYDDTSGEYEKNTWAILATSMDEAERLFREEATKDDWRWGVATIYQLSFDPDKPQYLSWHNHLPRHLTTSGDSYEADDDD